MKDLYNCNAVGNVVCPKIQRLNRTNHANNFQTLEKRCSQDDGSVVMLFGVFSVVTLCWRLLLVSSIIIINGQILYWQRTTYTVSLKYEHMPCLPMSTINRTFPTNIVAMRFRKMALLSFYEYIYLRIQVLSSFYCNHTCNTSFIVSGQSLRLRRSRARCK